MNMNTLVEHWSGWFHGSAKNFVSGTILLALNEPESPLLLQSNFAWVS